MSQKQMYAPCPCGSGKKYRFCCHQKKRHQPSLRQKAAFWAGASPKSKNDDLYGGMDKKVFAKAYETCQIGLSFMNRGEFDRAIPIFRKAMSVSQDVHTSANNLAVCLYVIGKIDEACDVQRESIEASTFENPFGWGNLAVFEYIRGNEEEAKRCVDMAVGMESPSADASIKVCEALARFERHQDILNYIDAGGFGDDSGVCFYTGVAAANCGDFKRAKRDLKQLKSGFFKIEMARRYLRFLNEESSPHTVMGNWPYLQRHEICPRDLIKEEITRDEDAWVNRRILVDLCEDLLNDQADDPEKPMTFLSRARHPAAVDRFWAIVKGNFGPDSLRMQALQALQKRGLVDPQEPIKVLIDGERREVELTVTRTNSDFRFTSRLPRKWENRYEETVRQMNEQDEPDWESAATTYLKVIEAVPGFFPARYNYAITLLNRGRKEQAEPILLELVEQHPEYLFAPSTLLQIYCDAERMDEADDLIQAILMPEETHPLALVAWLLAQYRFFYNDGRKKESAKRLQQAYTIMPDHPRVKAFWEKRRR